MERDDRNLSEKIQPLAHPLTRSTGDWDPLMDAIGDKSVVLLGEATHGTHEFYRARAEITQRLIEEKNFAAIAIEGDWPDALEINRFIHPSAERRSLMGALSNFQRFPMWMWRNRDFVEMIGWLWTHNHRETTEHQISLFGLDLYSLHKSMDAVIAYLDKSDPEAAKTARELYACFDLSGRDSIHYGRSVRRGLQSSCEKEAIGAATLLFENLRGTDDDLFFARRNAELVRGAESYYRNLFNPFVNTWNVRDRHMANTVVDVLEHLAETGKPTKIVIWAHNSHVGDDRATEMGQRGQWNIGQLLRQKYPGDTFTLGFTTHSGSVLAASEWDHPPFVQKIVPSLNGSIESVLHNVGLAAFFLNLRDDSLQEVFMQDRLERAIGVIYSPETERQSHYFDARLAEQFDAVAHFDQSQAVEPLDHGPTVELDTPSDMRY